MLHFGVTDIQRVKICVARALVHQQYKRATVNSMIMIEGAQWLSGRVLDSRPRSRGFEPHGLHCFVSLSKNINPSLVLVQPRKTCPFITVRLLLGRKESIQAKIIMIAYRYADSGHSLTFHRKVSRSA